MNSVVLPFDESTLWDIIETADNPEIVYHINVKQSYDNLKDKLLYYISNLGINVIFDWTDCDYNIKSALILDYLKLNRLYYNQQLVVTIGSILLYYKEIAYDPNSILTCEQTEQFIIDNIEVITLCTTFLDSALLYIVYQFKNMTQYFNKDEYQCVNDPNVPLNLVHLFAIENFGEFYTVVVNDNIRWFDIQFTRPIYNNESISKYVFSKDSVLAIAGYHIDQQIKGNTSVSSN